MELTAKILARFVGFPIIIAIFFGLPIAFMVIGAGHVEVTCAKEPLSDCEAKEALAFGIYPRTLKISDVQKAKLNPRGRKPGIYLVTPQSWFLLNTYPGNYEVRNVRKLTKNLNKFLKNKDELFFYEKSTLWTPFFVLGFVGFAFSAWLIVSSVLISLQPERKRKIEKLFINPDIKEIKNNLNLLYIPKISWNAYGTVLFLIATFCLSVLARDFFYLKNFDEISIFWILFLVPTFKLALWLKE